MNKGKNFKANYLNYNAAASSANSSAQKSKSNSSPYLSNLSTSHPCKNWRYSSQGSWNEANFPRSNKPYQLTS